jgi:CheY-like chemotaxis protein
MMNIRPVEILLVEDNPGDVLLTQEALAQNKVANHMNVARDGVEALEFLTRAGKFQDAPTPDLILLDLNLPRMDGRELLSRIKELPGLKRIPVVVLTTSDAEEDVIKTYDLHVNAYVTKPVDLDKFGSVIATIKEFWFLIVQLPPNGGRN